MIEPSVASWRGRCEGCERGHHWGRRTLCKQPHCVLVERADVRLSAHGA